MINHEEVTIILDGGMGRELERIGAPFSQPLWSAQALIEAPDTVIQAHLNFIDAGAQVITTNTYALVPHHLGDDLYREHSAELIALSADLAVQAREQSQKPDTLIAGCIPPVFGSYDAAAFDPETAPAMIAPFFTRQNAQVDLWIGETITSWNEARIVADMHQKHGGDKPLWLALTLPDDNNGRTDQILHSGEDLEPVLKRIMQDIRPDAILFNCCDLKDVGAAIKIATSLKANLSADVKIGAYANAFVKADDLRHALVTSELRNDITPDRYLDHARSWIDAGADIVGGCCGIMPDHIRALSNSLK
jgi:S-methylmethionine-dependent homocysteine/selenocysteine methylase